LYAGTLDRKAWDRAFLGIADLVRGIDALLLAYDPHARSVPQEETHRFDDAALAEYKANWVGKDVRLPLAVGAPVHEPQFEAKLLPLREWRESEIYRDFMRHHDVTSFLCTWLQKSPTRVVALTVQGGSGRGPFDARDADLIRPLLPHVRRATEIRDRLRAAEIRADSLASCLDSYKLALMVLDARGRVIDMSASARQVVASSDGGIRCAPDGRLLLRGVAGSEFEAWLKVGHPPAQNRDGLLRVSRAKGHALSLLAAPLPVATPLWLSGGAPRWVIVLFDPERSLAASVPLLMLDLGVSEREAEVTAQLVEGHDLRAIAARLDITLNTARSHLKRVYAKAGVQSQVELLRRIAAGPAIKIVGKPPDRAG
jgi:DNA-binding CsgD family transcriptional regulator